MLYYSMLYYIILLYPILSCPILSYPILSYPIPSHHTPFHFISSHPIPSHSTLPASSDSILCTYYSTSLSHSNLKFPLSLIPCSKSSHLVALKFCNVSPSRSVALLSAT